MKKTLLIATLAGISFLACKKDRTCTCTMTEVSDTVNGTLTPPPAVVPTVVQVDKLEKVTKNGAACNSGERTETVTTGTVVHVVVSKASCELTK